MKKKFVNGALIITSIVLIVGVILILSSGEIGRNAGTVTIQSQGGSMDTTSYERIINTTTTNFQITGAILSIIGGFGVLMSGYGKYKEL